MEPHIKVSFPIGKVIDKLERVKDDDAAVSEKSTGSWKVNEAFS